MSIREIETKRDLVKPTDYVHQLSADEFNSIVESLKKIQEYLSNVETPELIIQHDIPKNTFMVNTNDVEALLKFTPIYRITKTNTETGNVDTKSILTECSITVSSDKGSILLDSEGKTCYTGIQYSVDIKSLLATGPNMVKVMVSANGKTESVFFNVVLTALSLSENNLQWYKPFYSTDSEYKIGGFQITGMIDKTVHIDISGNGYHKHYTLEIGANTYTTNAYTYKLTNEDFPTTGTGSYKVDVYITSDNIETQHIIYDMLCVEESDISSAILIAVKQPTSKILNLTSLKIAEYVVYDGTSETSDVQIKVTTLQDDLGEIILADTGAISVKTNTSIEFEAQLSYNGTELTKDAICTISAKNKQKSFNFIIDNSTSIPPVPEASFYIDPANRYNSASDKESIINAVNNDTFEAEWSGVSFVDGVDGWTTDKDGIKALVLPAVSSCNINYQPLQSVGTTVEKVFDFTYKVENVSDYTQPIITICDNVASDEFVGIKIFPTKVLVHSNFKKSPTTYDLVLGTNIKDEELVNVQICMCPNYNINYGNFLIIYVNGVKKCEFAYGDNSGGNSDSFQNPGNIIFGGDYADFYLYSFRIYDFAFNYKQALTNFYSSLHTITEKQNAFAEDEAVLGNNDEINLDKVKDTNKYNYFIVEPLDNAKLPAYGLSKGYSCDCNFEMHYPKESDWDYYIQNATLEGQGTTAMSYYVWNLRVKTRTQSDSTDSSLKPNTTVSYNGTDFTESSTVKIDGGNHPAVKRITAKKNYASSMLSHKMGSTAAFNDLREVVYTNREEQNKIFARTAVYQYPAYGFIKQYDEKGHELYKFIGLYTIGPDKGDKATFGYDGDYTNTLLSLEGLDHNRPLTLFKYPWTDDVGCHDGENIGIKTDVDSYDNGWEISAANSKFVDTLVDTLWRPAYEQVYKNSPFIMPIDTSQSIGSINSDVQAFRDQKLLNGRKYEDYDIWTEDGTLYYYNLQLKQYAPVGTNVYDDVADYIDPTEWSAAGTLLEKNNLIIKARVRRFKETMSDYWDVEDTLFHYCFVMMFAASDNFAKNTYPYNLGSSNSKWMWRQDDLDTLFDIDNYGRATKDASVEYEDITADGTQYVFKGNQSAFWTLIHLAYEVYDTDGVLPLMGRDILHAMCDLGALGESSVQYSYSGIMKFFQKYYFDKAEEYFTRSSYNVDAEISYELAHADKSYRRLVDPLSLSLGNHIEATKFWLERRIIYLMSKYSFGEFGSYSATGLGTILVRPQQSLNLTLIPAVDMYPTIMSGQGARFKSNDRVFAGNSAYITGEYGGSGTNTSIYIAAADYIREIQGLEHLQLESNTGLSISSKRLQRLNIGETATIHPTTNIDILTIEDCPSLEYINAKNVIALQNEINLSKCPRIKEAYFDGTKILGITIANGAKIHTLKLPTSIKKLDLRNLPNLETFEIAGTNNLSYIRVENTPDVFDDDFIFDLLHLEATQNGAVPVRRVSTAIKIDNLDTDASDAQLLILLNYCEHADDVLNYIHGIDVNGDADVSSYPILSGTIRQVGENPVLWHTSQVEDVNKIFPYVNLLLQNVIVDFEDSRIADVFGILTVNLLAGWSIDLLSNILTHNVVGRDVKFNEFKYFENIEQYYAKNEYFGSTSLSEITLPKNLKFFYPTDSTYQPSTPFKVQKINLGENKNFELIDNCLIGRSVTGQSDLKNTIHCAQKNQIKIPSHVEHIVFSALLSIDQDVLVVPRSMKDVESYTFGTINKAIIFELFCNKDDSLTFGLSGSISCDVYVLEGAPNSSGSEWLNPGSEHHIYVPIGTKQQYVNESNYDQSIFEEFDPETDETFLSLMEEYNNMEI